MLMTRFRRFLNTGKPSMVDDSTSAAESELFSGNQLEQHGHVLANSHIVSRKRSKGILRALLAQSEETLIKAHQILTAAAAAKQPIPPAGEWLLDNFYLIEEQIRIIKRDLPKKYESNLPQLHGRKIKNCPRVYDILLQIIAHSDGRLDIESLRRVIQAYQQARPLTLGELWAVPLLLRLVLVEKLSYVSAETLADWQDRHLAGDWANRLIEVAESDAKKLVLVLADMVQSSPSITDAFVAELTKRLQSAALVLPLTWIGQKLAEDGLSIEELIQADNKQQAAHQVTTSNCIGALQHIRDIDWREFVTAVSLVEAELNQDPAGVYNRMDFTTRDDYRHVIEVLARTARQSELAVAVKSVELAKAAVKNGENFKYTHVGFYLIDEGLNKLRKSLAIFQIPNFKKSALFVYLSTIILITGILTSLILKKGYHSGINLLELIILASVLVLSISQSAVAIVNWISMLLIKPRRLPKMDFSKEIPDKFKTLVVVPAILGSLPEVETLVEGLEVRFLGNRNNNLYFALLTDFTDAAQEHTAHDEALLTLAQQRIQALNDFYHRDDENIFFLFHRPRRWNAVDGVWMGYERKRGKLNDLNAFLQNGERKHFSSIVGNTAVLRDIKYVITLDADTQLPRDSAWQYIGTMAHPLNQPFYNAKKGRVVSGYGILQPRIAEAMPAAVMSRYIWLCGNELGIDPYTRTVSNVYQDLFKEGSFTGKGIYDVALFQRVLANRFPENRILSHDLIESCYLRSGLISDVPLYENSPASYLADVKRRRRWVRGDWQIASWIFSTDLSMLSRWKLFDNLRRSLVAISILILIFFGGALLPASWFWLLVILGIVLSPGIISTLFELVCKPKEMLWSQHWHSMMAVIKKRCWQFVFSLACLPHEACYSVEAIVRTIWRLLISHRRLLEWVPSNHERNSGRFSEWIIKMWAGPVVALAGVGILVCNQRFGILILTMPLTLLWLVSPLFAWRLSRPLKSRVIQINKTQMQFLHILARRIWGFFETFVTAEDNWLPPDNYQEIPMHVVCHRTSPTNIGLALLANLTAYDFGYLTSGQLLMRTAHTFKTLASLERYHGHFYNWYDTQTLQALPPRYISTVDGGNLAGSLLTLRQGLLELLDDPLLKPVYLAGIEDTFAVLKETAADPNSAEFRRFQELLQETRLAFTDWNKATAGCEQLTIAAEQLHNLTNEEWAHKLWLQCSQLLEEIKLFANESCLSAGVSLRNMHNKPAKERIELIHALANQAFEFAQMDVSFLYHGAKQLMAIGFNVDKQERDQGDYDLLASEARLANFIAIAQGQVPQESWFALGRIQVTNRAGITVMMSWSGSMFEYLMPLIVMPCYPGSLLDQVCRTAVDRQIAYGDQQGTPWGISESGFNAIDANSNYLYRAFGVPDLGFKRGLSEDLVIAPYATVMALMVAPEAAFQNLQRLTAEGAKGRYGFYEAIDYTKSRLPRHATKTIIYSFMAHHQGMSLLALSYLLHNQPMQRRFQADPLIQATTLLLQERIPKPVASYLNQPRTPSVIPVASQPEPSARVFKTAQTLCPQVQLLSNGCYHVMITQAGAGYSRWNDMTLTRWREDTTCDNWGLFSYLCDVESGEFWSTISQPTPEKIDNFQAVFAAAHAEFMQNHSGIESNTEIVVSSEDDVELRRLRIRNATQVKRVIEFTSYAEVTLATQNEDQAQPAFSNLFVETELLPAQQTILVTRRSRSEAQNSPWLFHRLNVYEGEVTHCSFETSRLNFVGRGGALAAPLAMTKIGKLSNTAGTVLDPVIAIRCRITLEPQALVILDLFTGVTSTREQCVGLVEKYHDRHFAERIFGHSWTHNQVLLRQLDMTEGEAQLYEKMASAVIYASHYHRSARDIIAMNQLGQARLWGYSISGDLPIVLLRMSESAHLHMVRQLMQAQAYWRRKGLIVDLVILNEESAGYRQNLQEEILNMKNARAVTDYVGGIFVQIAELMPPEDRILLQAIARLVFIDKNGSLAEQIYQRQTPAIKIRALKPLYRPARFAPPSLPVPQDLMFFNGLGGYTAAGKEYLIHLTEGRSTPAPWVNILANPQFGALVSESGQAYTWTENAHEFRLTPWNNDPIQDTAGEAFYLRDEETGQFWSPTALPAPGRGDYQARHGFGYSQFEHREDGIHSELWVYVAVDAPVKFTVLKLRNLSTRRRRLSATAYVEWVLGDLRAKNAMHVVTSLSAQGGLLAENHYNTEFGARTAFFSAFTSKLGLSQRSITGNRTEFLGRNGSLRHPAALTRVRLSGSVGAGLDPCGAIQLTFDMAPQEFREIIFVLGAGQNREEAEKLMQQHCEINAAEQALRTVRQFWSVTLGAVQVNTPDPALDLLTNGWLLYQTLSSRLWGRTGYYQSAGAFGFRDQLQDVMAMIHLEPEFLRTQILLCSSRQFIEGDVQHWWHPPSGRGVRTRCSDDYLWLPLAICRYVETTGDIGVLLEQIPFLEGRLLNPDEESYYDLPLVSREQASVYQHGKRSILYGLRFGEHGLPLMGSGDWNDGMNLVGIHGRGESVWLGFFLYSVLQQFGLLANRCGDVEFAKRCDEESLRLLQALEQHGWDGAWYRRAYFDDGTPLGSAQNAECSIDSIAQSWSVLSAAGDATRMQQAMQNLYRYLVRPQDKLVVLLDPPFNHALPNPGYIKGYVPGIRENGGQYTHAAIWAVMAFVALGETERAWEIFNMINPVQHGCNQTTMEVYQIEPYVMAGDVYSVAPHAGRGGWSWYTGSAAWMYRLITESLLGLRLEDGKFLYLIPALPSAWEKGFTISYRYLETLYDIEISFGTAEETILDGVPVDNQIIPLQNDGKPHQVKHRILKQ